MEHTADDTDIIEEFNKHVKNMSTVDQITKYIYLLIY